MGITFDACGDCSGRGHLIEKRKFLIRTLALVLVDRYFWSRDFPMTVTPLDTQSDMGDGGIVQHGPTTEGIRTPFCHGDVLIDKGPSARQNLGQVGRSGAAVGLRACDRKGRRRGLVTPANCSVLETDVGQEIRGLGKNGASVQGEKENETTRQETREDHEKTAGEAVEAMRHVRKRVGHDEIFHDV